MAWTKAETEFLIKHFPDRLTAAEVAVILGKSRKGVLRKVDRLRNPKPNRQGFVGTYPGERHPRAVLTDDLVRQMRKRYAEGVAAKKSPRDGTMSIMLLANEFNVAHSTAYGVISRRTWKHI
jgi:hypothetical protein